MEIFKVLHLAINLGYISATGGHAAKLFRHVNVTATGGDGAGRHEEV
jgi:hypothetical protein